MTIDCTLTRLAVPGFPELIPPFGTKKPDGQPVTAREHNQNVTLPFTLQRPIVVAEDSDTTVIEAHTAFSVQTTGVTLTLGNGGFVGCEARIFNETNGVVTVAYDENAVEALKKESMVSFEWRDGHWKRRRLGSGDAPNGWGAYQTGRNLLEVLDAATIPDAMAILQARCNNGESAANGEPDFAGLQIGDYIDGLDLPAIPAENGGTAGQTWNDTYKNNRIVISGFNTYPGAGSTENTRNHILFTFVNCPLTKRINPSHTNTGGPPPAVPKAVPIPRQSRQRPLTGATREAYGTAGGCGRFLREQAATAPETGPALPL
jgi:hypothetical protein